MEHQPAPEPGPPAEGDTSPGEFPEGLLEQMERMMAALNADLSRLGADLRSPSGPATDGTADTRPSD